MIGIAELIISILFLVFTNFFLLKKNILIDTPNIEKHKKEIFFSKKVPKSLGLLLMIFILYKFEHDIYQKLFIFFIFFLGILSDIKIINSPKVRFFLQAIIIFFYLSYSKNLIDDTRIPFVDFLIQYELFQLLITLFCILIIINGSNFIDGLNTLCVGYYLNIIIIVYFLNPILIYQFEYTSSFIVIMCILFIFNFLGKSFLGDGGSYLLGFFLSIVLVKLHIENPGISPWFFAILLWYPAFEILFSIIRRSLKKENPFLPDNAHFHHLLYLYFKKKFNINSFFLNPIIANLINFFNLAILLLALQYSTKTIILINIFMFNCTIYLGVYFFLKKKFLFFEIDEK